MQRNIGSRESSKGKEQEKTIRTFPPRPSVVGKDVLLSPIHHLGSGHVSENVSESLGTAMRPAPTRAARSRGLKAVAMGTCLAAIGGAGFGAWELLQAPAASSSAVATSADTRVQQAEPAGSAVAVRPAISEPPRQSSTSDTGPFLTSAPPVPQPAPVAAPSAAATAAADALVVEGDRLLNAGRHGAAGGKYRDAIDLQPDHPAAVVGLARAYVARGLPRRAKRWARRALELRPEEVAYRVVLADALHLNGERRRARRMYREARRMGSPAATERLRELRAKSADQALP